MARDEVGDAACLCSPGARTSGGKLELARQAHNFLLFALNFAAFGPD